MSKPMGKGLGKGLTSLFGEETRESIENPTFKDGYCILPIIKVEPNKDQPRKLFGDEALNELSESIKKHGILTPITVRQTGEYFQIIAGERRWRAARLAGLEEIPAMIIEADEKTVMEVALIENLQREDLNAVELAKGFKVLIDQFGLTQDEVSERVGKSRPTITNALRILALNNEILEMIATSQITSGHARAILAVEDGNKHIEFAKHIASHGLSVRQAEAMAKRLNKETEQIAGVDELVIDYVKELSRKMESSLGRRVEINYGKTKGKIELEYYGDDDLERICEVLMNIKI